MLIIFLVEGWPCLCLVPKVLTEWPALDITFRECYLSSVGNIMTKPPAGLFVTLSVPPFGQGPTRSASSMSSSRVQVHTSLGILPLISRISHQGNNFGHSRRHQEILGKLLGRVWDRLLLLRVCQCLSMARTFQVCPCPPPVFLNRGKF